MSCKPACKYCTTKRRSCYWLTCGTISLVLTMFFALVLGLNLTDELFFQLIIKKVLTASYSGDVRGDVSEFHYPYSLLLKHLSYME